VRGQRYFVFFDSELYLVQLINVAGKSRSYIILTAAGAVVDANIRQQISELDLQINSLEEFDLDILDKVALNLLDLKKKSINTISVEIAEKMSDIKISLEELNLQGIVYENKNDGTFSIVSKIGTLINLVQRFTNEQGKKYRFISSAFVDSLINDEFIDYVTNRFKLVLSIQQKKNLVIICKVFPSALYLVLFRYTGDFENDYRQIESSNMDSSVKEKSHENMYLSLMSEVLAKTHQDLNALSDEYLDSRHIRGFYIGNTVKIASDSGLILDLEDKQSLYLGRALEELNQGN
jgi:hypothetical protein